MTVAQLTKPFPTIALSRNSPSALSLRESGAVRRPTGHANVRAVLSTLSGVFAPSTSSSLSLFPDQPARWIVALREHLVQLEYLASAWKRHVLEIDAPTDVDTLSATARGVLGAVARLGPKSIDLSTFEPDHINGEHLAVVLRATYTWRAETPGWLDAVQVARVALERAGLDPGDALIGLL